MRLKVLPIIWSFFLCAFVAFPVYAGNESFKNDYKVEYTVPSRQADGNVTADVRFTIIITNLKPQEYVDKISLSFPDSFKVSALEASDDKGPVDPALSTSGGKTQLTLAFNEPNYGINTKNTFHLHFKQTGLIELVGNVYEVMLPTVKDTSSYEIIVKLPTGSERKLAVSKPAPDDIKDNTIIWRNPKTRTIYAVFGDEQYYNMDLVYHLKNDKIIPVYQDIALPPDTLYQKTFIDKIEPKPAKVYRDEDGNYMARILLKPKEQVELFYEGDVIEYAKPREDIIDNFRSQFNHQKKYLLTNQDNFSLENVSILPMKTPREIYDYVTSNLKYDYSKINKNTERLGASKALQNPAQAICTEFTDTFVALARKNGIYAREIEGYGFSQDQQLRPLSLISDVLHAWPEYYNQEEDLWHPVDPTWENTSGIDYFGSFDINHIVLAIHGKESDYPYPAGSYKFADTKDVAIQATSDRPVDNKRAVVKSAETTTKLMGRSDGYINLTIKNEGNVYLWNEAVSVDSEELSFTKKHETIEILAPYEEITLKFPFGSPDVKSKVVTSISVQMFGENFYKTKVTIVPYYYKIAYIIIFAALIISGFFLVFFFLKNKKK